MRRTIATSTTNSVSIPVEKLGPPGVVAQLHVVPVFKDSTRSSEERLKDVTPRRFRVTGRLAKDVESRADINCNFSEGSGDSLFAIPEHVADMKVDTPDGQFFFYGNAEKRLSTVRFNCIARSSAEARRLFQKMVGPALEHLSYIANTPLHMVQVTIVDEAHQIISTEVLCPYPVITLNPGIGKVSATLAPVYAMYREAKNAVSPFYKFFCLYKILEGLLKPLKAKLYEEAKLKGVVLPPLNAKVPSYSDIPDDQRPYIGKSITCFFEEFLTTRYRNSMAHFISDEGVVLNVNEMEGIERYYAVVHVTDLCCREVISHFESCLDSLEKSSV